MYSSVVFSPPLDQQLKAALFWKLPLLFQVHHKADENTMHLLTPALPLLTAVAVGRETGLNPPLQLSMFLAHPFFWGGCHVINVINVTLGDRLGNVDGRSSVIMT